MSGNQAGDPVRGVAVVMKAIRGPNPPHRLLLGNDAYDGAMAELTELCRDITPWEAVSRGADYPNADSDKAA